VLKDAGYDITLASPNGGAVPVDPASLAGDFKTAEAERMLHDGELVLPSVAQNFCASMYILRLSCRSSAVCPEFCV
jgi:hypothetical protein